MQGKSVRDDLQRAVVTAEASRQKQAPLPKRKPVELEEGFNPNFTDKMGEQWAKRIYDYGYRAGRYGTDEEAVSRIIRDSSRPREAYQLRNGYEQGKRDGNADSRSRRQSGSER